MPQCPHCKTHQSPKDVCGWCGAPFVDPKKVPDEKLPRVVYDLCASCATGMRALRGVELIEDAYFGLLAALADYRAGAT